MTTVPHRIRDLVKAPREVRNVEYKSSMSWDDPISRTTMIKAILALSNVRDGGYLVIGVEEVDDELVPKGVDDDC